MARFRKLRDRRDSGRATLAHALLASATGNLEVCAYVDTNDAFDPCSAAASGVALPQLLWVRCGGQAEHAFQAADLLLHAGGFGVVILDLSHTPDRVCRRIPISYWYRFRRAIENTRTVLAVIEREPLAKSCASLILELTRKNAVWTGAPGFHLLERVVCEAAPRKPVRQGVATLSGQGDCVMFACIHQQGIHQHGFGASDSLRNCAQRFSPGAELVSPQTAVFDVSRLERLYGKPASIADAIARHAHSLGLEANVALAHNIDAAILAARNLAGTTVIPDDAVAATCGHRRREPPARSGDCGNSRTLGHSHVGRCRQAT